MQILLSIESKLKFQLISMIFFHRNFEKMFNISIYLNPHLQMLNNFSQPLYLHDLSVGIVSFNMQS